jgi:protein-tyrosine phosphatase
MKKVNVLFVCLGNICRSPLAEALFNDKVARQGLHDHFCADSCGTSDYHIGEEPDERTQLNALQNGLQINHRGRQLTEQDLEHFDYIFAMDQNNYANIMRLRNAALHQSKISLMRSFDPLGENRDVPDPYFGGARGFQEVYEILDRSTHRLLEHLQKNHV